MIVPVANRRRPRRLADRRSQRHITVAGAATLVGGIESFFTSAEGLPRRDPYALAAAVALHVWDVWRRSNVVLRVDAEFANALLNADTEVELVPDWMERVPFDAVGYSFDRPVSLHDGMRMCHYLGFLVSGIKTGQDRGPETDEGDFRVSEVFTRYMPISAGDGVRCLWLYTVDGSPAPQIQTVTLYLRGQYATKSTLAELIATQIHMLQHQQMSGGEELPTLVPLSLLLLLYSAAGDPDLDWPPAEQIARLTQIKNTKIGHLGWRTGAALRAWRRDAGEKGVTARTGDSTWRLPPHICRAHWHRVRVAERDESGAIVGNRLGLEGVDWHYEVRWYPPTPVNAEEGADPVVRDLE